jgi:hypothetical protein
MKTVIGVFYNQQDAENALRDLKNEGFEPSDVSVIMKDQRQGENMGHEDSGAAVKQTAVTGVKTGAAIGGLTGFLAGTIFPGLGLFLIGGPLAAALGLTGVAAATVSGVATGVVAGGLIGSLMGLGLSEEQAQTYEKRLSEGAILLAVPVMDIDETDVHEIFTGHHAEDITVIGNPPDTSVDEKYDYLEEDSYPPGRPAYAPVGAKGGKSKSPAKKPKFHHSPPHKPDKK